MSCSGGTGAPVDARLLDSSPDGLTGWPCSPHPPPLPAPSPVVPTTVFDTPIPLPGGVGDAGAIQTFATTTGFLVVTPRQVFTLSLDGDVQSAVLLALPDGPVNARGAAYGAGTLAVVVEAQNSTLKLCIVDPPSGIDPTTCSVLPTSIEAGVPIALAAPDGFVVLAQQAGRGTAHLWRYDVNAGLLSDHALSGDETSSRYVRWATSADERVLVATSGSDRRMYVHLVVGDADEMHALTPPDRLADSVHFGDLDLGGDDGKGLLVRLVAMRCKESDDADLSMVMPVLVRADAESATVEYDPVAVPFSLAGTLAIQGDEIAVIHAWDLHGMRISIVDREGNALISEAVPNVSLRADLEVQQVNAALAIGPRDYVFTYYGNGGQGEERHVARVRFPP
jgi:hypothetical protein